VYSIVILSMTRTTISGCSNTMLHLCTASCINPGSPQVFLNSWFGRISSASKAVNTAGATPTATEISREDL
jgi:hypothetical protein